MSYTIPNKYLILGISIVILAIFFGGWYLGSKKQKETSERIQSALKYEMFQYKMQLEDKTILVAKSEQEILTLKEAIKQGEVERKTLKALNIKHLNELTKARLTIDTLLKQVGHSGQIVVIHDTIKEDKNAILLPFSFEKKDQWLDLKGNFDPCGELDINLKMDVPIDLYTGVDKKTKKPTATLTTENPYINVVSLKSHKFDVVKPKRYGLGIFLGYGIDLKNAKTAPLVGCGINYNLISF